MASKILIIGDVNGQFQTVFQTVAKLHKKNNFAFALVAGNLFADPATATEEDNSNLQLLVHGKIPVPLTTYFAHGGNPLPSLAIENLEVLDDELCNNLYYLGKRTTIKTSEGIQIVSLGGSLDPNAAPGATGDKYGPFYTELDAKILRGAIKADILITSQWPKGIQTRSTKAFDAKAEPASQACIADLCAVLKPKYHFSTSRDFYEREPFFHTPSEETNGLYPITRFLSLAAHNNPTKQKWIYAFSIDPLASNPIAVPENATASPVSLSDKKRPLSRDSTLVYEETHHRRRTHKRQKREHGGPLPIVECFFCLANEIDTHLIASIGDNSYVTTAKGPLATSTTFPKLSFPGHLLIIPLNHAPTLATLAEDDRVATYKELQRYRSSMNGMLKSLADTDYGSVTWELSKSSFPHTHWQYLPVPVHFISNGLVEAAFKTHAESLDFPSFKKRDVKDGFEETTNFFRVIIWNPNDPEAKQTSLVLRFDESVPFRAQFGREVLGKLLALNKRIDWHDCGQTKEEEETDVTTFKEAFKAFDFTLE